MNKYKQIWNDYFEGGVAMWSYFGYNYHSYKIAKYILPYLDIPIAGRIVQFGTGLGITIEELCNQFGKNRVVGYDLFNPLSHPNIKIMDLEAPIIELPEFLAYTDIDIGSVSTDKDKRLKILQHVLGATVKGGYVLTNKSILPFTDSRFKYEVIELNSFDIPELWENVHESRLNTKILIKII